MALLFRLSPLLRVLEVPSCGANAPGALDESTLMSPPFPVVGAVSDAVPAGLLMIVRDNTPFPLSVNPVPKISAELSPTVAPVVSVTPWGVNPIGLELEESVKTLGMVVVGLARKLASGTEMIERPWVTRPR